MTSVSASREAEEGDKAVVRTKGFRSARGVRVSLRDTLSQMPVLRSGVAWIQSHPAVYCETAALLAITWSPPCPPGTPEKEGGKR